MTRAGCEIIRCMPGGPTHEAVGRASSILMRGGVILHPTDTIYGLGCLADNPDAIERIYAIKGRPESKPSLVLVDSVAGAERLAESIPEAAYRLMEHFWPGPLTLVLRAAPEVPSMLRGGRSSIGIRLPANGFCRAVVSRCGVPVVSTSANRAGKPMPRGIGDLVREFESDVDLIVDAGDVDTGPSTVVDLSGEEMRVIRAGVIPGRELIRVATRKP